LFENFRNRHLSKKNDEFVIGGSDPDFEPMKCYAKSSSKKKKILS